MKRANPLIQRHIKRRGAGLLGVLIVTVSVSAALVAVAKMAGQRAFVARQLADRTRAHAIAETGVSKAYAALSADFEARTNTTPSAPISYGGGSYRIQYEPVGEDGVVIKSTGRRNGQEVEVIVDARMHNLLSEPQRVAYSHSILVDGDISWTGCGVFNSNSTIHANGAIKQAGCGELDANLTACVSVTLKGNSGFVDGDVTAPEVKGKTSKVYGTITETDVAEVPIPVLELTPYYLEALAHGEVYEGSQTISHAFSPDGGIMWVNGNLSINGSEAVSGCFIATGDIKVSGTVTHTKAQSYPGFVSRDGDIKFSGSGTWEGLVYTRIGHVEIVGGGGLTGSIICGGDFKKAGSSTIFDYVESVPVAPNDVSSDGILCISAWQK